MLVGARMSWYRRAVRRYHNVPRLPVPALQDTAARYLESCRPLLSSDEFERTRAAVAAFTRDDGLGPVLQKRLEHLDKSEKDSWLEKIWLQKAYLEWREPSLINVNWWCQLADSKTLFRPTDSSSNGITRVQIDRAATLIANMLDFKARVDGEQIPQEFIKKDPLCMHQYTNIFGVTRVPGATSDTIAASHPASAKHIIVLAADQIYKVDVFAADGRRVSKDGLAALLSKVADDSNRAGTKPEPPVGLLTAGHRDTNFEGYTRLQQLSQKNSDNFGVIQTALFAVCLDSKNGDKITPEQTHEQIFHNFDASNRWFDKAIQLVVLPSGRAGVNGEHTPTDAVIPGNMMDFIVKSETSDSPDAVSENAVEGPQKLQWTVDAKVNELINQASGTAGSLIADTASYLLQTDVYGSQFVKDVAKASPDAFVQIALQLAWRRLYKEPTAIYESASIRLFRHGRTETIRSLTVDTWAFANAFYDNSVLAAEKIKLFDAAIKSQSSLAREAAYGRGVDRHLLALRTLIKSPEEQAKATLFTDPAYIKSMYFKLSTSNMSPGDTFYGGFGPVVPEGYGVNYAIGKAGLKFSISHKRSCPTTDGKAFRAALEESLAGLRDLVVQRK
ncbi:hypothetical protein HDU83_009389 [Entophlyctis luteolus]|nr:hypothetical protein HDU83_009389 [Entophlyctis luteolus]